MIRRSALAITTAALLLGGFGPALAQQDPAPLQGTDSEPAPIPGNALDATADALREALGDPGTIPQEEVTSTPGVTVVLRGLDKLTGTSQKFEIKIGEQGRYERLLISAQACNQRVSASALDASAFLQVFDTKADPPLQAYSGWMFASSPALSAMDHPRFDVWVLSCKIS
ncbi:MAG: DUF2155 domain-containing protein [Neomegalonema sp.]|nr:DUF2155 domain-containing protein [Neomegalonema sp.]